ncbi:hypothetical protein PPUJ20028_33160 [Pseudomonas putida]|uniref:Uncharacterized protein n=1 Tax=Pseudomonas putida TaxID=303 RepID=A0AA37RA99_PSEPU|nr:hypothetical protein [Pseudomonas putida]GLO14733.1 hypothetical protein PPUJ20028_33160 [Pseudomonas putida]GLO34900.1 hypothetical protein PPUN14671_17330 [Pseudomonas putida]HDS0963616.1 hypothetical protein [Pseudomonas putida]HDS0988876.1 hypothetical protein [Pseudomonas putida]
MNHGIADEVHTLFDALTAMLEGGELEGVTKGLPLCSISLTAEQTEEIRVRLQDKLLAVARGAVPVVSVGREADAGQAGDLHVHFLKRYQAEETALGWFVDVEGESCWYFKVANERSGHRLAELFNQPENRRKLDAHRSEVGVEVASLTLWLNHIRDSHVDVLQFGYKSTGQLHPAVPEMQDLC